jgi:hypothetical protein
LARSQGVPVLHAQAGLTKDRAQDRHGNVVGMPRDSDSTAVWMNVPGMAATLPAVHKPRPFTFSKDSPAVARIFAPMSRLNATATGEMSCGTMWRTRRV